MSEKKGRFGDFGGQYVPETVMNAVNELDAAYEKYRDDPEFTKELAALYRDYAGRPSMLYYAEKMTEDLGGARIYIKREDLNHTGSHKINNVLGQILLAKRMGKTRIIAEREPRSRSENRGFRCWEWIPSGFRILRIYPVPGIKAPIRVNIREWQFLCCSRIGRQGA
ncbi:MAG: hypothetical protein NC192_09850 [Muribaculaceae bacterium]|nr:hypothetical protein [Muribaculaceae bacterium]